MNRLMLENYTVLRRTCPGAESPEQRLLSSKHLNRACRSPCQLVQSTCLSNQPGPDCGASHGCHVRRNLAHRLLNMLIQAIPYTGHPHRLFGEIKDSLEILISEVASSRTLCR